MLDNWQDISAAPKNEPVLICTADCKIVVATFELYDGYVENKIQKMWGWFATYHNVSFGHGRKQWEPKVWQPLPLPPKYLYERKLAADLLEKQIKELRS